MKVVHITTGYNHGGAAIACKRLVDAQRNAGIDAVIITQEEGAFPEYVYSTTNTSFKSRLNFLRLALEKFIFLFYQSAKKYRFQFSLANTGENIVKNKYLQDADLIHLHWTNGGFVSLKGIKKLLSTGKPVVWTLHDIWPLTGGCHIVDQCENYKNKCSQCFYLKNPSSSLALRQQKRKYNFYGGRIYFIAPSSWQMKRAKSSWIFNNNQIALIPNPLRIPEINKEKNELRTALNLNINAKIILFGAFNVSAEYKGMQYLLNALIQIKGIEDIELAVFGKKSQMIDQLPFKVNYLGYISEESVMLQIYKAVDVFVTPSVEDNLPNTILESFSVGTPVVAFKTGGIPDIVDHKKNGYLAEFKNENDLANGITWCLENNKDGHLGENAIKKVQASFNPEQIGEDFYSLYEKLIYKNETKS